MEKEELACRKPQMVVDEVNTNKQELEKLAEELKETDTKLDEQANLKELLEKMDEDVLLPP